MPVTPVVAPYVPNYASRTPYITPDDYTTAPTGTDYTQLIPGGTPEQNRLALAGVIERASSAADVYCQKVLAATTDTQSGKYRLYRDGTIRVPVEFTPVILVTGVSIGFTPAGMSALTDLSGIWPDSKVIEIPVIGQGVLNILPQARGWTDGLIYANVTYVNGWFHSTMPTAVNAGVSTLTPGDAIGAVPGLPFTIYDGDHTELVQVASNYVVGAAAIPLATATQFSHVAGCTVSAVPPAIRQAVISLTSAFIKKRGGDAIVMASIHDEPRRTTLGESGMTNDEATAYRLLAPFRRIL